MTERKSLEQLASEASEPPSKSVKCPRCGCADFKTYGTIPGTSSVFRYKSCRHCRHRIVTNTVEHERIIRDVRENEAEEPNGMVFRLA
jgi:DNA-directed RNA polymerase subunit RPC12/RpoP